MTDPFVAPLPPKTPPYHLRDRDEATEHKHLRLMQRLEELHRSREQRGTA